MSLSHPPFAVGDTQRNRCAVGNMAGVRLLFAVSIAQPANISGILAEMFTACEQR